MPDSPEEFAALIAQVRLNDDGALAKLIQTYETEVRRTAQILLGRVLRSYLDPADLVQSVHRSLITGLRQNKFELANPQQLRALAGTLLRRKVIRHWRHWHCQQLAGADKLETKGAAADDVTVPDPQVGPASVAEYKDLLQRLVKDLSEADRRLVELRLRGFSTAEAARQLGHDPDIVRVRLSRLRQRWRDARIFDEWL